MVIVKKLYGVSDSGFITIGGFSIQEMFGDDIGSVATHVGKELREELMGLPKRTKVGVQYFEEFCDGGIPYRRSLNVKKTGAHVPKHAANYWTEILGICKMRVLDVEFLDDYRTLREVAKKLIKKDMIIGQIKNIELNNPAPEAEIERAKQGLIEELYRVEVEAEHLNIVTRSDKILENIVKECPEIVIVGSGHADYFMANPQLMETIRIKFESYAREQYGKKTNLEDLPEYLRRPPQVFGKLVQNAEPDKAALAEREKVERQNKAITLGRIIASKEPAWIGTWDVNIPPRGLFEVYVDHEIRTFHGVTALEGKIEDIYGSGQFIGSTDDSTLIFRKEYGEEAIAIGGYDGPIMYETPISGGTVEGLKPGVFRGTFTKLDGKPKPFYIREFSEDPKLEKLRRA
ncbi:MAG: hypothetical protein ABIH63_02125 [archaeon]